MRASSAAPIGSSLTDDLSVLHAALGAASPPGGKTSIAAGLAAGLSVLQQSTRTGPRALFLLTDGGRTVPGDPLAAAAEVLRVFASFVLILQSVL